MAPSAPYPWSVCFVQIFASVYSYVQTLCHYGELTMGKVPCFLDYTLKQTRFTH